MNSAGQADEQVATETRENLIYQLVWGGDWQGVRSLIAELDGAASSLGDPHLGSDGGTALHVSVEQNAPLDVVRRIIEAHSSAASVQDKYGHTALHVAGLMMAEPSIVGELVEAHPDACLLSDRAGSTPLHCAAAFKSDDWGEDETERKRREFARIVLAARPDAALATDRQGFAPIHLACRNYEASAGVVRELVRARPESALSLDGKGDTPLHLASQNDDAAEKVRALVEVSPEAGMIVDAEGRTPLHSAIFWFSTVDVVRVLVEACPESVAVKSDGLTPLELLCKVHDTGYTMDNFWEMSTLIVKMSVYGTTEEYLVGEESRQTLMVHATLKLAGCPLEIIRLGFHLHQDQLELKDADGNLPLHIAAESAPTFDATIGGKGQSASGAEDVGPNIIDNLVSLHGDAAKMPNKEGRLPLSLMIHSGATWQGGMKSVLEANPAALLYEDIELRYFPYILLKVAKDNSLKSLFRLLRDTPMVVRTK